MNARNSRQAKESDACTNGMVQPWLITSSSTHQCLVRAVREITKHPRRVIIIGRRGAAPHDYFCVTSPVAGRHAGVAALRQVEQGDFRRMKLGRLSPAGQRATPDRPRLPREVERAGLKLFTKREALLAWLKTPASWAEGRTPRDLLRAGQVDEVVAAMKGLLHGNFL